MKKIFNKLLLISMVSLLFFGCKKEETRVILRKGIVPALAASSTNLVLTQAHATDTSEIFSWTASQYGFIAAVKYTLQIAKTGTNFATPKEVNIGSGLLLQKYSQSDFNTLCILLGLPTGSASSIDVRVKSSISDSIPAIYSNTVTMSVTPYFVIINYPSLWNPGDYQGWDPGSAPKISSVTGNGVYEGYFYVPSGGTYQFKITSQADWNGTNYGWASSSSGTSGTGKTVSGTLSTSGSAGNLFFPNPPGGAYYYVKANTGALTWYVKSTTWGIIGDAPIASNNWSNDVPMTYDIANKVWTVTTNFQVGSFKFRANGDWSDGKNNFGDDNADLSLDYGGANIAITTAGVHTITLDLHLPGQYTYKIQ